MRRSLSAGTYSDHVILLRVFQLWQEAGAGGRGSGGGPWCSRHHVSAAVLEMVVDIRNQLLAHLRAAGFVRTRPPCDIRDLNHNAACWPVVKAVLAIGLYPNIACVDKHQMMIRTKDLNHNAACWPVVKAVLAIGLYPNIACVDKHQMMIRTKNEKKITIHQASSLRDRNSKNYTDSLKKIPSNFLVYEELTRTGTHINIKSVTNVSPLTIALFSDTRNLNSSFTTSTIDGETYAELTINNWINFQADIQLLKLITDMRTKINNLVTKRINCPEKNPIAQDDDLIRLIASVLLREDHALDLQQPIGIGQRPKTFMVNTYPMVNNIIKEHKKEYKYRQTNRTVPDILRFKQINPSTYNQYQPHFVNTKLEDVPGKSNVACYNVTQGFSQTNSNMFYSNVGQSDVTYLSQNLLMMNLYNPTVNNLQYYGYQNAIQNDFESNGVNVNDEDGEQCTRTEQTTYSAASHHLLSWFNSCDPLTTAYFIIKAGGMKSIDISISKKTWIFSPQTERKLVRLVGGGLGVVLLFTVQGSQSFQGVARLLAGPQTHVSPDNPVDGHSSLACPVEWLSRADIPFSDVRHLLNPMCVDGLEVSPEAGAQLCLMFTNCAPVAPVQNEPFDLPPPSSRPIRGIKQY